MTDNATWLLFWHSFPLLERVWFPRPQAKWDNIWYDTASPDYVMLQLNLLGDLWSGTSVAATLEAIHPSFHVVVASWDNSYICEKNHWGHCGRLSEEALSLCLDISGLILLRGKEHPSGLWYKNIVCYRLKEKIGFLMIAETTTKISEMQTDPPKKWS